jgi:hypothetical protein
MAESRIDVALNNAGIPDIILKPEQVKCFEYILQEYDVIAVLSTGFGKSLLYQLLPDISIAHENHSKHCYRGMPSYFPY